MFVPNFGKNKGSKIPLILYWNSPVFPQQISGMNAKTHLPTPELSLKCGAPSVQDEIPSKIDLVGGLKPFEK